MEDRATTDRGFLREQYSDSSNLSARVSLYDFQQPLIDLPTVALAGLDLPVNARVVDVGCAYGRYVERLLERSELASVVAADLSPGMVQEGRERFGDDRVAWVAADAQHLPLADDVTDAVLAMHMLYHVPDIAAAVREARRVLRNGGTFLVSTNNDVHLRPLYDLVAEVAELPGLPGVTERFRPVHRGLLDAVFGSVEMDLVSGEIVLDDPAPAVAFVASGKELREPLLGRGGDWDAVVAGVERRIAASIERDGDYRLATEVAIFRCL